MPVKQQHTDVEIAELAERLRESWHEGQVLRSWLRMHADELRTLNRQDDWSWTNLGRAMTQAGIVYRTGNPWTGENLRRGIVLACRPLKERQHRTTVAQDQTAKPNSRTPMPLLQETIEPEFRIVRRRPARGAETDPSKGEP